MLWFILRLIISIALVIWIFKSVDLSMFKQVALSPRIVPSIAMIAFSILFVFLGGLKLWILMKGFSPITMKRFMIYFFLAGSVGSLVPAIIGDFTLIGLLKRNQILIHQSVSAMLMDRFITVFFAVFIFTPFTIAGILPVKILHVICLTVAVALLSGVLVRIVFNLAPSIWGKIGVMGKFWNAFTLYFTSYRRELYINILICGLRGIVSGMTLIFALMAADLNPPIFDTICISNSLSILTHIPVSLSGLGVFEGSGLLLFEMIGLNRERVLAGLFYHRLYIIVWAALTAIILTSWLSWKKHRDNL